MKSIVIVWILTEQTHALKDMWKGIKNSNKYQWFNHWTICYANIFKEPFIDIEENILFKNCQPKTKHMFFKNQLLHFEVKYQLA